MEIDTGTDAAETNSPPAPRRRDWEALAIIPLLLIILLGAYFRFTGLDWDGSYHLHPDERFLTDVASLLRPVEDPLAYLRTSESTLNPYNVNKPLYVYGNFPMTVTRYVAEWATIYCRDYLAECPVIYSDYSGIHLVGRFLTALVDLGTIIFAFFIGRRLYDYRVGLLAAFLQAAAVLPIQQSHFFTMDNWAAALTTVTMYAAVRASESAERKRWWVLFGLFVGLTVAARINMAPLAAMAAVAGLIWLSRRGTNLTYFISGAGVIDLQRVVVGGLLAGFVAFAVFRFAQPYAFADSAIVRETVLAETGREPGAVSTLLRSIVGFNPQWLANLAEIQRLQSPDAAFPPANQWTDRTPIVFPFVNIVLYGMGITAGLMAWAGFFWALWRVTRAKPEWRAHALPVVWIGMYFLFMGTRWVKSIRYFLPIYPFLFILAGWALMELWRRTDRRRARQLAVAGLMAIVLIPTLLWANAFMEVFRQPVTRVLASEWMLEHVPSGGSVLYEVNGEAHELQLPLKNRVLSASGGTVTPAFELPAAATVTGVRLNYLSNVAGEAPAGTVAILLPGQTTPVEQALALTETRQSVLVDVPDVRLEGNTLYQLTLYVSEGGPVDIGTSIIANEHWDDPLPVRIGARDPFGQYFSGVSEGLIPITVPDDETKRANFIRWLDETDYIVLSSQRALWSLPRLGLTFPMTTRYYEGLFNGDLGFELVNEFHADIHVGPLYISDTGAELGWGSLPEIGWPPPSELAAEEAFSVYDHPPVWIFAKQPDFDSRQVATYFNEIDLSQQVTMNPGQATEARNGLLLTPEQQAVQQANGTFAELFDPDGLLSQNPALAAVVWWLALVILGWLTFPLAFVVLRGLSTKGYVLSRVLGLLLISYFGWITASIGLLPNNRATYALGLLIIIGLSALSFRRHRPAVIAFVRENITLIAVVEAAALSLFLLAIAIRLGNPDVWDVIWGGEKPMDLAYFTAVLKSQSFPPYDPWFAGGYINYYYYGFVFVGALTQLLAVVPTVAYNLILPMLFSFTGMGAFSVAYNLAARSAPMRTAPGRLRDWLPMLRYRALLAGFVAIALSVLLGNLAEVGVTLDAWQRSSDSVVDSGVPAWDTIVRTVDGALDVARPDRTSSIYPGDWFWTATRAINYEPGEAAPITEFPFFTFLYGDLHAHMIAMPLMLLALAWAVSLALRAGESDHEPGRWWESGVTWLSGGIAIGVLRATNTWDWPTYLVIGALAVAFAGFRQHRGKLSLPLLGQIGLQTAVLVGLATVLFLPFAENYGQGYASVSLWPGSYTQLGNYLVIHGLFLFLIVTLLLREFRAWTRGWTQDGLERLEPVGGLIVGGAIAFVLVIAIMLRQGYLIAPFVLTLVVVAGLLGLRPGITPERRIVLILVSAALALTLAVEIVVIDGDIGRMNMVFKFYIQVWLLLSVAGGVAAAWVLPGVLRRPGLGRTVWLTSLALLLGAASLYPILATRAKWAIRMSPDAPKTLDGMAFMKTTSYGDQGENILLSYDYDAIQWMHRNIEGSPVIAEAHSGNPYRSIGNRVSMYTGLPAIVGWDWHQRQQRAVVPGLMVSRRIQDVNALFSTTDVDQALRILDLYDVQYIYAGQLEWVYYPPEGLNKFEAMAAQGYLEEVYRNSGVSIYRVRG